MKVGDKVKIVGLSMGNQGENIGEESKIVRIYITGDYGLGDPVGGVYPAESLKLVEKKMKSDLKTCFGCHKKFTIKELICINGKFYCYNCRPSKEEIRTFNTGATRDIAQGKLDYTRALCPLVLERYVQYLNKHRKQPDGSFRDFDNWKKGLPFRESFSSLGRHNGDLWKMIEGFAAHDNHGLCNIDDTLCAIIFNASTMLRERLVKKAEKYKE